MGKTHCATHGEDGKAKEGLYRFRENAGGFWNLYQGQSRMLIDEMNGKKMSPTEFNELCDKYPLHINVKGGQYPCLVEEVDVTSNYPMDTWWKTGFDRQAGFRRVGEVHYHYAYKKYKKYVSDNWEENPTMEGTAYWKFLEANPQFKLYNAPNGPL
jgi:hypothetical protein